MRVHVYVRRMCVTPPGHRRLDDLISFAVCVWCVCVVCVVCVYVCVYVFSTDCDQHVTGAACKSLCCESM